MLKSISLLGLLMMFAALAGLCKNGSLVSPQPFAIAVQGIAIALMVWARLTFGHRSFHPLANPTSGGLVTTGPYRYIRHPIYTAACLFCWGGIVVHLSLLSAALGVLLILGGLIRMACEEQLITQLYREPSANKRDKFKFIRVALASASHCA